MARSCGRSGSAKIKKWKAEGKSEITQKRLAKLIQVSDVMISEWEQGKQQPGFLNVLKYCEILDITLNELLGTKEEQMLCVHLTKGEQDTILSMFDECQRESEISTLHSTLHFLEQHIKAFFSRAQSK